MPRITNPILKGFNPDPSICRAGEDYYIVTSTFEWFPGVQIHHSRDLVNWRLIGHGLKERRLLDLMGVPDSGGIWAPSLSYADGQFWLMYTIVRNRVGTHKDLHNYLITAPTIDGPWSDPIYLNSSGFDASLFHDPRNDEGTSGGTSGGGGRKWVINMQWDHRKDYPGFGGIILQEYDPVAKEMVGPIRNILKKPGILIEGPNLYKKDGYYYLMLAEGGTGWNHGISMARSKSIDGPYELDPQHSVMTTRDHPGWPLQKAGHGELVQTQSGEWYMVHLCSRPLMVNGERKCVLGRETALQKVVWSEDGWLRLASGSILPDIHVDAPRDLTIGEPVHEPVRDEFDGDALSPHWASLRIPADERWATLRARPGWLRLRGRESLHSLFEQSLLAKRLQTTHCVVETCLEFEPTSFLQMAGLVAWYDTKTHYYLRVSHDEKLGKVLGIVLTDDSVYNEPPNSQIAINGWQQCYLRAEIDGRNLRFSASPDGLQWTSIGPVLDASKLSDDYGQGLHFTGAFVGVCAQDLGHSGVGDALGATPGSDISGGGADFAYFEMRPVEGDVERGGMIQPLATATAGGGT